MTDTNNQLALQQPASIQTLEQMETASQKLAASGLMGPKTTPEMVYGLMLLCQCEGLNPVAAMKRYHIVEGRPSMRADAMQAEFLARGGAIIFHVRTDEMVAATLFADKDRLDDAARTRAAARFETLWRLDCETDEQKRPVLMVEASKFSMDGEETIIRTFADCRAKGITEGRDGTKANWKTSPRQMLTARVITEGVRLVNPGLIAGIYSEDETADIVRQEREATRRMLDAPSKADTSAILEIIAGYDEELSTDIPDSRRKTLLGLRADLVCKLGDIGEDAPVAPHGPAPTVGGKPATVVEAVVLEPAAPVAPAPKKEPAKRKEPAPVVVEPEHTAPANWQDVKCHIGFQGKPSGQLTGRTMAEIFTQEKKDGWIASTIAFFHKHLGTSPIAQDKEVLAAAVAAHKAWTEERAKSGTSTPETPASTVTAPATTEAPQQPAKLQGWRDLVVTAKSLPFAGKKLGDLGGDEVAQLDDYLGKVDWDKATLSQKSLKANFAMMKAEEFPSTLPLAANEEPEHTASLKAMIETHKLNRNSFMSVCKKNGWIDSTAVRIEDISEDECGQIIGEWDEVSTAVRADQP